MGRKRSVLLASLLLAVVLCGAAIWAAFVSGGKAQPDSSAGFSIDARAEYWDDSKMVPAEKQDGIKIPGSGTICFPWQTKTVPITLYNPKENDCYFLFQLYVDREDTRIYYIWN